MGVIVLIDNSMKQRVKMFLPKLIEYLDSKSDKIKYKVVRGDVDGLQKLKEIQGEMQIDGVIMSGSPLMPTEATDVKDYVCNLYCLKNMTKTPILGICFGCQLIHLFFGGKLLDLGHVTCKRMKVTKHNQDFLDIKEGKFCARYLPLDTPSKSLEVLMTVNIDTSFPCVIKHRKRDVMGVMFHPEALKSTHKFLDAFIDRCIERKVFI
jgi:anthranilate/para-aminobenzoate synthase component II